jgi:hypothetical protein
MRTRSASDFKNRLNIRADQHRQHRRVARLQLEEMGPMEDRREMTILDHQVRKPRQIRRRQGMPQKVRASE